MADAGEITSPQKDAVLVRRFAWTGRRSSDFGAGEDADLSSLFPHILATRDLTVLSGLGEAGVRSESP
jgi:hypothetical protein